MTTRVTCIGTKEERLPLPSFLASRGFAIRHLLARELPSLNLEKKRDCLQSKRFSSRVTILLHGRDFFLSPRTDLQDVNETTSLKLQRTDLTSWRNDLTT